MCSKYKFLKQFLLLSFNCECKVFAVLLGNHSADVPILSIHKNMGSTDMQM